MSSSRPKSAIIIIGALLLVIIGFTLGTTVMSTSASTVYLLPKEQSAPAQISNPATDNERSFYDIYNRVSPSVVSISVRGTSGGAEFGASGIRFDAVDVLDPDFVRDMCAACREDRPSRWWTCAVRCSHVPPSRPAAAPSRFRLGPKQPQPGLEPVLPAPGQSLSVAPPPQMIA